MASWWDTVFGGAAEKEAADKNRQVAAQYGTEGQGYLTSGYNTGVTNLNKAVGAYDPLVSLGQKYGKAGDLNLDALGVNGPEGNARATAAFQTTPGYELTKASDLEAINRRRAIGGMSASGNADQDTIDYVTKALYGTQYAPWLANLAQAGREGGQYTTTAAGGQAGGYGSLASLGQQYAQNQVGVAGNVASGDVAANNLQAQGEASGAKNLLGAGLSLASLAMMPLGGAAAGVAGAGGFGSTLLGKGITGAGNLFGSMLAPKGGYTGFTGG
jgi:hypothetical protein